MSQHVYARLSGFGWTVLPLAPFRFERVPHQPKVILVEHQSAEGPRRAKLDFERGLPAVKLADGTDRLEDILELLEGPDVDHWKIETSVYSVRWPEGFVIRSTAEPPGFDLAGPSGTLIFLQGPFDRQNLPPLAEMVGPEQSIYRLGTNWIELAYEYEGEHWRQTHRVVDYGSDAVVVTSQAPESWDVLVSSVADRVAESLLNE